ncbi:MAG TPA: hypothetical protein VE964_01850 [Myxococcales bacterium]|nr:hypothetical protein [Myxococcales bacterium]
MAKNVVNVHTVDFEIDSNGNPVYRPAVLRASRGDKVQWKFRGGAFAVLFRLTPFDYAEFGSGNDTGQVIGSPGVYPYAVALVPIVKADDQQKVGKIVLDAGCPEIIIQR